MARILLVEPFLGGSHRAWAEGWASHSRHDIEVLGHEGRHWRWRMRGGSVSLARDLAATTRPPVDVVVASNMLDFAAFRGMVELPGARVLGGVHGLPALEEGREDADARGDARLVPVDQHPAELSLHEQVEVLEVGGQLGVGIVVQAEPQLADDLLGPADVLPEGGVGALLGLGDLQEANRPLVEHLQDLERRRVLELLVAVGRGGVGVVHDVA